ncbi:MAG: SsrA-binding protein [Gemmatimonadetes bacterium]|nr:MAG: SsrA-binding protein [Gemmatimonadota bacterium]
MKPARLPVPPLRRRFLRNGNLERCITPSQCVSCRRRVEKISIARNPKARHDYHLLETWEAGLVLTGTEVKSLRDRKASLNEAYAHVRNGEVWLEGMTISHYGPGSYNNPPPARSRKLLLHKREIRKLLGATTQKGLTVVPLELYFKDGLAKVAIALAKAKKAHDKREELKRRVAEREMARVVKGRRS